jgi:hypothetical protein
MPFDHSFISLSLERDAQRSPGLHLSTILRDMRVSAGIERGSNKPETDGGRAKHLTFEQGFLWERMAGEYIASPENRSREWEQFVEKHLDQLTEDAINRSEGDLVRPGECIMDGIYMTPDGVNLKLWHLEEWKATAIRKDNLDIKSRRPEWLWQVMAYMRFYRMHRAVIRVWHYGQYPPDVSQKVIDVSDDEIDQNWNAILTHREYMIQQGRA